jgi:hypothetical protein
MPRTTLVTSEERWAAGQQREETKDWYQLIKNLRRPRPIGGAAASLAEHEEHLLVQELEGRGSWRGPGPETCGQARYDAHILARLGDPAATHQVRH